MKKDKKRKKATEPFRQIDVVPAEVWQKYPGNWIIYSDDEKRVLGVAPALEDAIKQARESGVENGWHFHHSLPPNVELWGSM